MNRCYKCDIQFEGHGGIGMNMGFGPIYYCEKCCPPKTAEEVIAEFEDFMNPPKGNDE